MVDFEIRFVVYFKIIIYTRIRVLMMGHALYTSNNSSLFKKKQLPTTYVLILFLKYLLYIVNEICTTNHFDNFIIDLVIQQANKRMMVVLSLDLELDRKIDNIVIDLVIQQTRERVVVVLSLDLKVDRLLHTRLTGITLLQWAAL